MATSKLADLSEALPLLDLDTDPVSPSYNQYAAGRNSARDIRVDLLGALFAPQFGAISTRPGVLAKTWTGSASTGYFKEFRGTAQGSPSRVISLPLGNIIANRAGQGAYLLTQESDFTITMPNSDGSLPRIDRVYALAGDKGAFGADAFHGPVIMCETGTPNASPTVPAIPSDGVLLMEVYRRAGATGDQIAQADITDKRKGTALAGCPRPLLGGDSLSDAGGHHGDRRLRVGNTFVPSAFGVDSLEDYWSSIDFKWHGTNRITMDFRQTNPGTITNGSLRAVASPVLSDPGWPFKIAGSAKARVGGTSSGTGANTAILQLRVGSSAIATTYDGTVITAEPCPGFGTNGYWGTDYGVCPTVQNGSITVYKTISNSTGVTVTAFGADETYDAMTLEMIPV